MRVTVTHRDLNEREKGPLERLRAGLRTSAAPFADDTNWRRHPRLPTAPSSTSCVCVSTDYTQITNSLVLRTRAKQGHTHDDAHPTTHRESRRNRQAFSHPAP